MSQVQTAFDAFFQSKGVPFWLQRDISSAEGGSNIAIKEKSGFYSSGPFQIYTGPGGQGQGLDPNALLNEPAKQVSIAGPPIVAAYNDYAAQDAGNPFQLLLDVADHSGHPDSNGAMPEYALQNFSTAFNNGPSPVSAEGGSSLFGLGPGFTYNVPGLSTKNPNQVRGLPSGSSDTNLFIGPDGKITSNTANADNPSGVYAAGQGVTNAADNAYQAVEGPIQGVAKALGDISSSVSTVVNFLGNKTNWEYIGIGVIALIVVIVGVRSLAE